MQPKEWCPNKPKYEELPSSTSSLNLDVVNGSTIRRDVAKFINENGQDVREQNALDSFLNITLQSSGNDAVVFTLNEQFGRDDAVTVDVHTQVLTGSQKKVDEGEREVLSVTSFEESQEASVVNAVRTTSTKDQVKSERIRAMLRVCATVSIKLNGLIDGNKIINKTFIY